MLISAADHAEPVPLMLGFAAVRFTILGQPYSKANGRRLVTRGTRMASVKSKNALGYEADALRQIPPHARQRMTGPLSVTITIYYASERPDLDESLILDVLQDRWAPEIRDKATGAVMRARTLVQAGVYRNDRQVRERHVYHGIDRKNPRAEITVLPLEES